MKNPTLVFPGPQSITIEDREVPTPSEGQLLIRTQRTLVSTGTELTVYRGEFPESSSWSRLAKYPFLPGYSNVGVVVEVGVGVDASWIGKRVGTYGPHAAYVVAPCDQARLIHSDRVSDEVATFFTIAEIVLNGVRRSQVRLGESVAVYGLGLLGQLAARFARLSGALPVLGIDMSPYRLSLLESHESVIPVQAGQGDITSLVKQHTRDRLVDVVFEVTGNASLIPSEFDVLRNQGRFVVLSSPRDKTLFDFHDLCNAPSYTIIGAHNYSHPNHATPDNPWTYLRDGELFFDLVASGSLDIEPLISHRASFEEAVSWYPRLDQARDDAMGVVFTWPA